MQLTCIDPVENPVFEPVQVSRALHSPKRSLTTVVQPTRGTLALPTS
jgi:hypothetical protein